jgi:hypothetical protein
MKAVAHGRLLDAMAPRFWHAPAWRHRPAFWCGAGAWTLKSYEPSVGLSKNLDWYRSDVPFARAGGAHPPGVRTTLQLKSGNLPRRCQRETFSLLK